MQSRTSPDWSTPGPVKTLAGQPISKAKPGGVHWAAQGRILVDKAKSE